MSMDPAFLARITAADGIIHPSSDAGLCARVLTEARDLLGVTLPDEYMELLRLTDGLAVSGLVVYGARPHELEGMEVPSLVDINLSRRDYRPDLAGLLVLGEVDDEFLVHRGADGHYAMIDRVSLDPFEEAASLQVLLDALLEDI